MAESVRVASERTRRRLRQIILVCVLTLGGLAMIAPLTWVILSSVKRPDEIIRIPIQWLPENVFNFANFAELFSRHNFGRYFLNSFTVAAISLACSLVVALMASYAFAYYQFKGKQVLFVLVLALFMVPPEALVIPQYLVISQLHLVNTYLGLAFPDLFTVLGVYLLRQFMEGIPYSLVEAARIDGAGEARILVRIITPMVAPAIAVFVIIKFLFSWNNFLWPLLVAQSERMYTVTVGLVSFAGAEFTNWSMVNAATVASMIPTIILFITLQRYLVQGVAMSGMK